MGGLGRVRRSILRRGSSSFCLVGLSFCAVGMGFVVWKVLLIIGNVKRVFVVDFLRLWMLIMMEALIEAKDLVIHVASSSQNRRYQGFDGPSPQRWWHRLIDRQSRCYKTTAVQKGNGRFFQNT